MNGICRLCDERTELRNSHIFPEFLYKRIYDEKHRAVALSPIAGSRETVLQKGLREYLLCGGCEGWLSRHERYAAEVLRDMPNFDSLAPGSVREIQGVQYESFKIFQLSLLWRAGVAQQASFQHVSLGPHESKIRSMVLRGDPGEPWEYGCVLCRPRGDALDQLVKFPGRLRLDGHVGYHMMLWGMVWIFIVSSHAQQIQDIGSFLSCAGMLPIHVTTKTAEQVFAGMAREYKKIGALPRSA